MADIGPLDFSELSAALEDMSLFANALVTEDEVGAVLRMHLAFEKLLGSVLSMNRSEKNSLYLDARYFHDKLKLCVALGLPLSLANVANQISKIRNNIAHYKEGQGIKRSDVDRLSALVRELKDIDLNIVVDLENSAISADPMRPEMAVKFGTGSIRHDFIICTSIAHTVFIKWLVQAHTIRQLLIAKIRKD